MFVPLISLLRMNITVWRKGLLLIFYIAFHEFKQFIRFYLNLTLLSLPTLLSYINFTNLQIFFQIGGEGLNLIGADIVIFLEHDWNPVKDLQAMDRAHRIGQRCAVNVYRLITEGSIEQKIMRLQKFKTDTANVGFIHLSVHKCR